MGVLGRLALAGAAGLALFAATVPALAVVLLGWHGASYLMDAPAWHGAARRSLMLAETSTAIAWPIGIMAAFGLWGARRPHRRPPLAAALLPLLLPPCWSARGLDVAASYGFWPADPTATLVFGQAVPGACLVVLVMTGFFNRLDPQMRQEAAACGASPGRIRRLVLLPNLGFPLAVSAAAAFAFSLGQTALAPAATPATLGGLVAQAAARHEAALAPGTLILACMAAAPLPVLGLIWLLRRRTLRAATCGGAKQKRKNVLF